MPEQLAKYLQTVLSREVEGFESIKSCQQLTAGASQETWRIDCSCTNGELQLALRRSQSTAEAAPGVGSICLETEARLFQLAGASGIPGPCVLYVLQPSDLLGAGFIMQWLDGETLGQRINRAEELALIRPQLAYQCGEILGRIHALDWRAAGLNNKLESMTAAQLVNDTWAHYCDLDVPVPMIDYTWRWLLDNLPEESRMTLVHGDFRNGNLMVTPQGINAVLDWELAHIGNPAQDLGWLCVNSWRFGNSALAVGGFGEIEDLLAGYRNTSSVEISRQELEFWQVFGSFWWAMVTLQMADAWRSGETPSLERPVIGRRSSEAQMDCINLIIPGDYSLPETDRAISDGTQLPMPAELLEGVAKFLKEEVVRQLDPHNSFLARVAANSLGIAQREFQYGATLADQEKLRLEVLLQQRGSLGELRWALVDRLREKLPLDTPGLSGHLRLSVAGQLFIDQPTYSALGNS